MGNKEAGLELLFLLQVFNMFWDLFQTINIQKKALSSLFHLVQFTILMEKVEELFCCRSAKCRWSLLVDVF